MKIVMLAKYMSFSGDNPWLTDELARELHRQGAEVHVILLDRSLDWPAGSHELAPGLTVEVYPLRTAASRGGLFSKLSLLWQWRKMLRAIKLSEHGRYDLVINFSIAALFSGVVKHFKKTGQARRSLLVLWDFFPVHQLEIGRLKSRFLGRMLYAAEHADIASYDIVGLMSEKNIEYFNQYHPGVSAETLILPIWGARPASDVTPTEEVASVVAELVDPNCFNVIFGGQLVRGRGVESIVDVAARIRQSLPDVRFLILGDGELREGLERRIATDAVDNVVLCKRVDRDAYRAVVAACDVGLVVTVSGVSIPSFPSKVIDYMLAKKPVIACTEESSDFGDYIEHRYQCGLSAQTDNLQSVQSCVEQLHGDPDLCASMGENAYRAFLEHHDVESVARRVRGFAEHE